jgi:hypothetical protein
MRSIALIAVLSLVGVATAAPRRHRAHKRTDHATARVHKRARALRVLPPPTSSPDPLEPQLQLSAPQASVRVAVAEPREAPPPAPQEAPPPAPQEAPPPTAVARVDLVIHNGDAPPPAVLDGAPAPRPPSRTDLHRQRRWGLFGGGLAMFLIGYGADIGLTYGFNHQPATNSLIPFAGPLIQTGESWAMVARAKTGNPQVDVPANQRIDYVNAQIQTAAYAILAVDCAVQLIGTGLAIAGVVGKAPTKYAAIEPSGSGLRVRF